MTYSLEVRKRVIADADKDMETRALATKYCQRGLGPAFEATTTGKRRHRATTTYSLWLTHAKQFRKLVRDEPDTTLAQLLARSGLNVSLTTLWRAARKLRLRFKKKPLVRCVFANTAS